MTEPLAKGHVLGRSVVAAALLGSILWLNAYICKELFAVYETVLGNSMHGFWIGLARWSPAWFSGPAWWPFWDMGMPIEYTYAPLFPALIATVARLAHVSEARAFHLCLAGIYCLAPATLFWCAWRLIGDLRVAYTAGILYSLTSPALFLAPNSGSPLNGLVSGERLYLLSVWDEAPHLLALALWPVAVLALFRIAETRSRAWLAGGSLVMAGMAYASAFGTTILVITATCLLIARRGVGWHRITIAGSLSYLAACQFLPPSLLKSISVAAKSHGHGWSARSWAGLFVCVLAVLVADYAMRKSTEVPRFFLLLSIVWLAIVLEYQFLDRLFLPQPGRYKCELSLCLALAVPLLLRNALSKLPVRFQLALWAIGISLCGEIIISQRTWSKSAIRAVAVEKTIEYRAAAAVQRHVDPPFRVMLPGSIGQWANAFSMTSQLSGGSWATALNPVQQKAVTAILGETGGIEGSMAWFRAFGVGGVVVSGSQSPEFWKPFADPNKYEGRLERLWSEDDTTLYRVPMPNPTLAHAIPCAERPKSEWSSVVRYSDTIAAESSPGLSFVWKGREAIAVSGQVTEGYCISVQVNYHPGWQARVNGRETEVESDGIGLTWIRPQCNGACEVTLHYDGGLEIRTCRMIGIVTSLSMVMFLVTSLLAAAWRRVVGGQNPSSGLPGT